MPPIVYSFYKYVYENGSYKNPKHIDVPTPLILYNFIEVYQFYINEFDFKHYIM